MINKIDARGLACPEPVLRTKEVMEKEKPNTIKVTVDNEAARENVSRFLESRDFWVSVEQKANDFEVIGKREEGRSVPETTLAEKPETEQKKIMVMVATDRMGHGDDELGSKLMVSFLKTLVEMGSELWRLVFVNNGVKLTTEGADVLSVLKGLEHGGIHILVCGTCLNHFNLLEKKQVGETTNMLDIVTAMQLSDMVINI
ncbi:MAG: sulfurtransferase-like selenium metabolism protein YedF [Thermodesulfobacteriota bacterium]|nr:sulfurtransferase-like selenium metabolism protein YedF [Thermodesulfobacteriota bacterium]